MRQSNEIKNTNPLVNHILKEHIGWHTNAPKAGFGTRSLIMNLMNLLSEQEIVSLAENVAKKTNRDTILLLENEYTMRSALDFIEDWIKISGCKYKHHKINDGQIRHKFLIRHYMGIKWSIYMANLYQFLFDELNENNKRIEFEKTENTLVFTVDID